MKNKISPLERVKIHRKYIVMRIINSAVAGLVAFVTSMTDGKYSKEEIAITFGFALLVFLAGIKDMLEDEIDLARQKLFTFF